MEKNILAIDDEIFIRELVQDFLEIEGMGCEIAANLKEALDIFKKNSFDLILLDRNLEDKLVEDVVSALRKIQNDIPIIIMTGDLDVPDTFIKKYNIAAVIHKPFQYDYFIDVINKNL